MNDDEQDPKLVLAAETALAAAPLREPEWVAFAARIESALGKSGQTDDSLLLPPLPESIEDGHELVPATDIAATRATLPDVALAESRREGATESKREGAAEPKREGAAEPKRESASLADLARAAVARRENKDAVSLAKESLAIASKGRAELLLEPSIVLENERTTVPPTREQRERQRQQAAQPRALDTRGPWIGVAIAAMGLAAGFGLYLRSRGEKVVETPVAQGEPRAPSALSAPPSAAVATAETSPTPADALAQAQPAPATSTAEPVTAEKLAREETLPKPSSPASAARSATANSASARPEKIVLEEEHTGSPAAPTPAAKPTPSAAMRPAELNANGGVADRPTSGAAQAAVGSVLGAARACLAGQPQASSATIVFGSSGEVTGVSVSGPAQGTPAASCVQVALGKARVQPFAAPSFSLGVTVRPP